MGGFNRSREKIAGEPRQVGAEEVRMAIKALALRKSAGPDVFPTVLYKRIEGPRENIAAILHYIPKTEYVLWPNGGLE